MTDAPPCVVSPYRRFLDYQDRRRRVGAVSQTLILEQMKHTLYEDPITHKFALVRLPDKFADGDPVPVLPTDQWFDTREEAIAALPELLNQVD
jgi:hypothetical protein